MEGFKVAVKKHGETLYVKGTTTLSFCQRAYHHIGNADYALVEDPKDASIFTNLTDVSTAVRKVAGRSPRYWLIPVNLIDESV